MRTGGVNPMQHETNLTVRFGETDLLGHVNNASYFSYLEHARTEFFKLLSSAEDNRNDKWNYILATIKCDFRAQAYFDQELVLATKVSRIGNKSFTLIQPIYDKKTETLIAHGESVIVYFDFDEQRSKPIPESLRKKLEEYLEPVKS
jgi:acyl-CoA thioester hydrolase